MGLFASKAVVPPPVAVKSYLQLLLELPNDNNYLSRLPRDVYYYVILPYLTICWSEARKNHRQHLPHSLFTYEVYQQYSVGGIKSSHEN